MPTGLPMFPLGTVLLPHMVLPLHIFEPRYRTMLRDLAEGERAFGVVPIERGREVGGGEVRGEFGTIARIVQSEELPDGRWLAVTVGTRRFRVIRWFPDDPYPQAEVEELPEEGVTSSSLVRRDALVARVRRLLALRTELGEDGAPSTFSLAEDVATSCWQLLVLTPLHDLDATRLLRIEGWEARFHAFEPLLAELEETAGLELDARR